MRQQDGDAERRCVGKNKHATGLYIKNVFLLFFALFYIRARPCFCQPRNDGVGWGKEGRSAPGGKWDVYSDATCQQNNANRISHLGKVTTVAQCEAACGAVPSCVQFQYANEGHWCELFNTTKPPHQSSGGKFECGCRGPAGCPKSPKGWGRYGVNCDCGDGCLFHLRAIPSFSLGSRLGLIYGTGKILGAILRN